MKPGMYVCLFDMHYPKMDNATFKAAIEFIKANKVQGVILGGDQFDNQCISPYTKGKPLYRDVGAYKKDEEGFKRDVLGVLERAIPKNALKVWLVGNHDDWEYQLVEEQPELLGVLDRVQSLDLENKGWQIVKRGHVFKLGKLNIVHGDILTGIGNQAGAYPSRKAVDIYAGNVLAGHTHNPQTFTKISPVEVTQKWQGIIAPVLANTNPAYLRNRPTAWLSGFAVVELRNDSDFNVYSIIVSKGVFTFAGKTYGKK